MVRIGRTACPVIEERCAGEGKILVCKRPSLVKYGLGIGRAQVLSDPDAFMMLSQQLTANGIAVFRDDSDEPVDVFRVIADEFREFLHLRFQSLEPPQSVLQRGLAGLFPRRGGPLGKGRNYDILLHVCSFARSAQITRISER